MSSSVYKLTDLEKLPEPEQHTLFYMAAKGGRLTPLDKTANAEIIKRGVVVFTQGGDLVLTRKGELWLDTYFEATRQRGQSWSCVKAERRPRKRVKERFDDVLVTYTDGMSEDSLHLSIEQEYDWQYVWRDELAKQTRRRDYAYSVKLVAVRFPDGEIATFDDEI